MIGYLTVYMMSYSSNNSGGKFKFGLKVFGERYCNDYFVIRVTNLLHDFLHNIYHPLVQAGADKNTGQMCSARRKLDFCGKLLIMMV